jgi:hypothetical protein
VPADSTLVVLARPRELLRAASTRTVVSAIFSSQQLERFAARTGVDPRELDELAVAVHPEGRVILARGPIDAPFAVREAGERMAPLESSTDQPFVRRAGFLGVGRVDVAALSGDTLLWIDGTPQLAAAVLTAARGRADRREHPFSLASVDALREAFVDAPFVLIAPHPLDLPRDTPIGMLLAREEAMAVAASPSEGESLRIGAELRGEFPPAAEDNFRTLAASIAESDLGAAVGARDALPSLRVSTEDGRVAMTAEVGASTLATGLRAVLLAEMPELLDAPPSMPSVPPRAGEEPVVGSLGSGGPDAERPTPAAAREEQAEQAPTDRPGPRKGRPEPELRGLPSPPSTASKQSPKCLKPIVLSGSTWIDPADPR